MGGNYTHVPWDALKLDTENKRFVLGRQQDRLDSAPELRQDPLADMADVTWEKGIHAYYGTKPHGDQTARLSPAAGFAPDRQHDRKQA